MILWYFKIYIREINQWSYIIVPPSQVIIWQVRTGDLFHKSFMSSSLKSCEINIVVITILMIQSGHKFAHVTTAELSSHVQNCGLIW